MRRYIFTLENILFVCFLHKSVILINYPCVFFLKNSIFVDLICMGSFSAYGKAIALSQLQ